MNTSSVTTNTDRDNDEILTVMLPPPPPMSAESMRRRIADIDRKVMALLATRIRLADMLAEVAS